VSKWPAGGPTPVAARRAPARCGPGRWHATRSPAGCNGMRSRRVLEKPLPDGVLTESAMVHGLRVTVARARPIASGSRAKPSMSARQTANSGRDRARQQLGTDAARGCLPRGAAAVTARPREHDPPDISGRRTGDEGSRNGCDGHRSTSLSPGCRGRRRFQQFLQRMPRGDNELHHAL
jgi:hypothetical protein